MSVRAKELFLFSNESHQFGLPLSLALSLFLSRSLFLSIHLPPSSWNTPWARQQKQCCVFGPSGLNVAFMRPGWVGSDWAVWSCWDTHTQACSRVRILVCWCVQWSHPLPSPQVPTWLNVPLPEPPPCTQTHIYTHTQCPRAHSWPTLPFPSERELKTALVHVLQSGDFPILWLFTTKPSKRRLDWHLIL